MTACLYCAEPIEPGQDVVRGRDAAAHRKCVREKVLDCLQNKYPERPTGAPQTLTNTLRAIREAGFTEADMMWD